MSNTSTNNEREKFSSRLGFIFVSAGCAIGIGNVWKFPYLCGQYGGAFFILIYLVFLLLLAVPALIIEFTMGRKSQHSAAKAFDLLEPKGSHWHHMKWISVIGCYLLMMFYTTVSGWMFYYCVRTIRGDFVGANSDEINEAFNGMLSQAPTMVFWTIVICIIGFAICYFGIQKGLERISKYMMSALLILMVVLAVHSLFLKGSGEGIRFYLVPNFANILEKGIGNVIYAAMGQAFFTLGVGLGSMLIFGSYLEKDRSLTGEALTITVLDTSVALMAGFIIIPACFAFGVDPGSGPGLIFITLPNIFAQMNGGRIWGAFFFLFMTFAAFSTVVAVFENLIAYGIDLFGWTRKKSVLITGFLMILLSMPCALGYNLLSDFHPLGIGTTILDLEDFIVSNTLLPLGCLVYVLFCTRKSGWGWDAFIEEADLGKGIKFPPILKNYVSYIIPLLIIIVYLKGYYDTFSSKGTGILTLWMILGVFFIGLVFYFARPAKKS